MVYKFKNGTDQIKSKATTKTCTLSLKKHQMHKANFKTNPERSLKLKKKKNRETPIGHTNVILGHEHGNVPYHRDHVARLPVTQKIK